MNAGDIFRELRYWLETLDSATAEVRADQLTRGSDAWRRNEVTFLNQMRMQNSYRAVISLLQEARRIVADDSSPESVAGIAQFERLIRKYIARHERIPVNTTTEKGNASTIH